MYNTYTAFRCICTRGSSYQSYQLSQKYPHSSGKASLTRTSLSGHPLPVTACIPSSPLASPSLSERQLTRKRLYFIFVSFYKPDANIGKRLFGFYRVGRLRFLTSYWWSSLLRSPPRLPERRIAGPEKRTRRGEQADASGCGESHIVSSNYRSNLDELDERL